jgi:hypothetical protein
MGRDLKRVALDFDHPLGVVWPGYVNPYDRPCLACNGQGVTPARQRLSDLVSLLLLSGEDSLKGRNHPYFERMNGLLAHRLVPTPDLAELTSGLSRPIGRERPWGHDSLDRYLAVEKIIWAAGLDPAAWGLCQACQGSGIDPALVNSYRAWKPTEPPAGPSYQVWETVSLGAPVSPVCATPEELVAWLLEAGYSEGAAEQFVIQGSAPTGLIIQQADGTRRLYHDIESLNAARPDAANEQGRRDEP